MPRQMFIVRVEIQLSEFVIQKKSKSNDIDDLGRRILAPEFCILHPFHGLIANNTAPVMTTLARATGIRNFQPKCISWS